MIASSKPEHLTRRIMVSKRRRVNSNSSGQWLHRLASQKFPWYAITIIPRVWFSDAFQVSLAIFKTFFEITCILCIKIKLQPELHVLLKGMRITVWSGSIQWCRRTICGVWVLANQNARLTSHAQQGGHWPRFGRHTAFMSEPCAIWKHFVRRISVFKSP